MIASARRLPVDFVAIFAIQFAMAKYPYIFNGNTIPLHQNELFTMAGLAVVGALLFENLIWRLRGLRKDSKTSGNGK